jgi:hypothetical protein
MHDIEEDLDVRVEMLLCYQDDLDDLISLILAIFDFFL